MIQLSRIGMLAGKLAGTLKNEIFRSRSRRGRKIYRRHIFYIPKINFTDTTKRLAEKAISHGGLVLIIMIMLLYSSGHCAETGQGPAQRFDEANQAYTERKYQQAITIYRSLIGEFGFSAELLHNLANSYAGAGRDGEAILHYLRGLRIAPGDDDLRGDLAMIRERNGLFSEQKSLGEKLLGHYDMNQWALLALCGYGVLTLLLMLSLGFRFRKGRSTLCLLLVGFIALAGLGAYRQHTLWNSGVITEGDIRLLTSPFDSAASLGSLEEGTLVHAGKQHGDYHYVQDEKGRSGWIPTTSFEQINTSHITYSQGGAGR